jgi:hypothetical protein
MDWVPAFAGTSGRKAELEQNWQRGQALEALERIPGLEDDQDHLD